MVIREIVESIIEEHKGDTKMTALKIVKFMDEILDVGSNGWLDNDPEAKEFIDQ